MGNWHGLGAWEVNTHPVLCSQKALSPCGEGELAHGDTDSFSFGAEPHGPDDPPPQVLLTVR